MSAHDHTIDALDAAVAADIRRRARSDRPLPVLAPALLADDLAWTYLEALAPLGPRLADPRTDSERTTVVEVRR